MNNKSISRQATDPIPKDPLLVAHIVRELEKTGDLLTPDFEKYKKHLDQIAPVRSTLVITRVPEGFPPDWVREQWEGIFLPIRTDITEDGVEIVAREAIEALYAKRPQAYEWWQNYYETEGANMKMRPPKPNIFVEFKEWSSNLQSLTFPVECGSIGFVSPKRD